MVRSLEDVLAEQERVLADDRDTRSRSDSKRSREAVEEMLARLTDELVGVGQAKLQTLELPESVLDVVTDARAMKVGAARNRQLRLVRQKLREHDWFSIRTRLQHLMLHGTALPVREGAGPNVEAEWTVRLLSEGDPALDAFVAEQPGAERGHLRSLLREAKKAAPARRAKAEQRLTAALAAALRARPAR
jgi:ribosome-associated protein